MRSVVLHFAGLLPEEVVQSLRRFGAREQDGAPWLYPASGDPVLYIDWYRNYEEISVPEWRALERELGSGPDVSLVVHVSGRTPGEAEVRSVTTFLLKTHGGAAQDDHGEHVWTLPQVEADATISGRRFFSG